MKTGPYTYDFVDSRNLQGIDARLDKKAQQMGAAGPTSPIRPRLDNGPTAGEVRRANREAVGGAPKRCQKGKNCSATCIARGDDCLVDFPVPVQDALRRTAQSILNGFGRPVTEEEDEAIGSQLSSLYKLYGNSVTGKAKSGQNLYPPEVAKKYADFLRTGKYAVQRQKVSDEDLEAIWKSLDQRTRQDLMNKGQPPREIKRDAARGKEILRQLLETGFRDEITGQPYSWKDIQPDHKVPISLFKGDKKDVEKDNLVMVHKGYNGLKGALEGKASKSGLGEDFVNQGLLKEFDKQSKRSQEEFQKLVGAASEKDSAKKQLRKTLEENSPLWGKQEWISNILSLPSSGIQALMSIENKNSGLPNRFSPSYSQGRNYAPKYASQSVLAAALLLNKGVPVDMWPPKLLDRAAKDLEKDLNTVVNRAKSEGKEQYESMYRNMFYKFTKENVPPELSSVFSKFGV